GDPERHHEPGHAGVPAPQPDRGEDEEGEAEAAVPPHRPAPTTDRSVNSPCGRSTRASTIAENSTIGAVAGDHAADTTADTTPTAMPAANVPTTCPIPPRMTTANTMPNHSYAAVGLSALVSANTIPAAAALAPATPTSTSANPNASTVVTGKTNRPTVQDSVAYGLTSPGIRRKSALQISVTAWMAMISSPKLTSSEVNSATCSRSYAHCTAAPTTNSTGPVISTVRIGSRPVEVASW